MRQQSSSCYKCFTEKLSESLLIKIYVHIGEEAKRVFDEAQVMLQNVIENGLLAAHGVVALLPAYSEGDDIKVLSEDHLTTIGTLHGLRQQVT